MKKLIFCCTLLSLSLLSCDKQELEPSASPQDNSGQSQSGQRILSEIKVGESAVTFFANGDNIAILTRNLPGEPSLLDEKMEGLTFAEIHKRLAPGKAIPSELMLSREKFDAYNSDVSSENKPLVQGNYSEAVVSDFSSGTRDLNDTWFRGNYCNFSSFYNGYKACLLNRSGSGGDWAWANCSRSRVYVYPYQGGQVHLQGKIDGSTLFDADLLVGYVYTYYMYSGTNIFGCRTNKQHYYSITQTSGDRWHWSLRSNTDC